MHSLQRFLCGFTAVLGLILPNPVEAEIDTTADAHGDFGFRTSGSVMFAQSFMAFSSHIGEVTLMHQGGSISFYLLITGARADATTAEGFSPDFTDILYTSALVSVPFTPNNEPIPSSVNAVTTPGERIFIVGDAFSENAWGGTTIKVSNLSSINTIDGSLLWVENENIPPEASALTDFNIDGAFTDITWGDLAIRIAAPEPGAGQMQAIALLAIAALSAHANRANRAGSRGVTGVAGTRRAARRRAAHAVEVRFPKWGESEG